MGLALSGSVLETRQRAGMDNFGSFSLLPAELRSKILAMAFESRVIDLQYYSVSIL